MEPGFLSQKGSGGGRGVKEKNGVAPSIKEKIGVIPSVKDGVTPTITVVSRTILVQRSRKAMNFYTLLTPGETVLMWLFQWSLLELLLNGWCPKNIDSDMVKNMKNPSQAPKGVSIGPKVGFKPTKQVFRQVSKKNNVNTSSNKKKDAEPTIKVSNSNPFNVLNSVKNDVNLGTNGGTFSLASQKVNSSGSSFWNVESSSPSTTLIFEKIDKMERLIIDGKLTLLDDEGKPLKKVDSLGDYDRFMEESNSLNMREGIADKTIDALPSSSHGKGTLFGVESNLNFDSTSKAVGGVHGISATKINMPCVPGRINVTKIFGVQLKTLEDINKLTKGIELDKPSSYVDAVGGSKSEPSKSKTNFCSLFLENLCEGANFSIPRKVVEMVFSEDGLSIIASQIGKPVMLDSYTSSKMALEPSDLGISYEIEIASRQLVEIDKVIQGCKLEIEGYVFDINLIPFGSGSFDVIIGMDWQSDHKAEIICHEKVEDQKLGEIVIVRNFPKVILDDLSGLPPIQEIKFQIELIPGAILVVKSPHRLAPSEMEEFSGQLKELQDKGFIRPSSSP
ncbi:putative reverse transcriptase domain-containing protein [Tanacetum coccineum]|uniref:Reverse transcriptase domain-containing protein n=1 Tax=Tanacetum coccineum TaxID=301880 RepID=A0ABQ4ZVX6_9ASTR